MNQNRSQDKRFDNQEQISDSEAPVSNDNTEEFSTMEEPKNNVVEMPKAEENTTPKREFKVIEISATEENAALSAQEENSAEQPKQKRAYRRKAAAV